jgi:hypothetical protein
VIKNTFEIEMKADIVCDQSQRRRGQGGPNS